MYLRSVRSDPRSVVTRKVDNLRRATADVEIRCSSTRTGDRRNRDQGFLKRLVHRNDKRSSMHRAGRAHVHICITATENDSETGFSQCAVYRTLEVRRGAKIAGPQLRAEGEKPSQRRYRHKIAIEGDLRLATAVRQQQGCVGKTRIPRAPGLQRPTSLSV